MIIVPLGTVTVRLARGEQEIDAVFAAYVACPDQRLADSAETLIWTRHVCSKDGVDFLLTAREPDGYRPKWHDYHHLLSFVSKKYDFVIFDLPELINSATSEVVRAAKTVYVMTTPEFISLKLARQRLAELRSAGATPQAVRILVNRHHSSDPSPDQIAD